MQVVSSTASDARGFLLNFDWVGFTGGVRQQCLVDIGIGGSGSETVLIENIHGGNSSDAERCSHACIYVPIPIPAGTRIAQRAQVATTGGAAQDVWMNVQMMQGGDFPMAAGCETLGANTADSGGTEVDPGTVSYTFGSWTEISAGGFTRPVRFCMVRPGLRAANNSRTGDYLIQLGMGSAGSEVPLRYVRFGAGFNGSNGAGHPSEYFHLMPIAIPAGQRIAARCWSNETGASLRIVDVIVHGFY